MRLINKIVIHCSDSPFGDAEVIDGWHKDKGWDGIGYHYVILNGYPKTTRKFVADTVGKIETGRDVKLRGAHVRGYNTGSIGVCMIGTNWDDMTDEQNSQMVTLIDFIGKLVKEYGLTVNDVYGHYELDAGKKCPCMEMNFMRAAIKSRMEVR